MYDKLVIIGNGFDCHLGLETNYEKFYSYLKEVSSKEIVNWEIWKLTDFIYSRLTSNTTENEWHNLEKMLPNVLEDSFITFWGKDDEDVEDVKEILDNMRRFLYTNFKRWIGELNCNIVIRSDRKPQQNHCYISFNYTQAAQIYFSAGNKNMFYLHGKANQPDTIVLGHAGLSEQDFQSLYTGAKFMECIGSAYGSIQIAVLDYIKDTTKKHDVIIRKLKLWIRKNKRFRFNKIKEVYILGHSMSDVDKPYFNYLSQHLNKKCVWKISSYDEKDTANIRSCMKDINIKHFYISKIETLLKELS